MRVLSVFGYFLFSPVLLLAQYGEVLPVQFNQFYQHVGLVNPASTAYKYSRSAVIGNKSLEGIFKEVNTNLAAVSFRIGTKDSLNKDFHGLGATFLSSREGPYFTRSRLYFSYAWHNSISENWRLSLGLMTGLLNHLYKETDLFPARSAMRFTSDVGLFLYRPEKISIGISLNQFVKSNMAPLEPGLYVKPFVTFVLDHLTKLSPNLGWKNSFISRGPVRKNSLDADLTSLLVVQEMVSFGLHYKIHRGYSFVVGLESGKMRRSGINLFFSYYRPFQIPGNINSPEMELTLSVFRR
jgi:hypothetical protein